MLLKRQDAQRRTYSIEHLQAHLVAPTPLHAREHQELIYAVAEAAVSLQVVLPHHCIKHVYGDLLLAELYVTGLVGLMPTLILILLT